MSKNYYSLGLMSGTSGDGVDASIIKSGILNKYNFKNIRIAGHPEGNPDDKNTEESLNEKN